MPVLAAETEAGEMITCVMCGRSVMLLDNTWAMLAVQSVLHIGADRCVLEKRWRVVAQLHPLAQQIHAVALQVHVSADACVHVLVGHVGVAGMEKHWALQIGCECLKQMAPSARCWDGLQPDWAHEMLHGHGVQLEVTGQARSSTGLGQLQMHSLPPSYRIGACIP